MLAFYRNDAFSKIGMESVKKQILCRFVKMRIFVFFLIFKLFTYLPKVRRVCFCFSFKTV